ncbi:WD40 repeat-like protein, partial [Lepidopterella palustris CBS 459.81]
MAPQASFLILNRSTMRKVHLAENYLVVGHSAETTVSEEFNVLDVRCQHKGFLMCEHRRRLPAGRAWDFDCCGDMMAVGNEDSKVRVWDLKTGNDEILKEDSTNCLILAGHTTQIKCVLFPDTETIISGAWDGGLIVWDVPSGIRRYTLEEPDITGELKSITSLKTRDNLLVSAKGGGTVGIWDLNSGQSIHILETNTVCLVLEFNADRSLLATGACEGVIKIWNVNSGACIATCPGHTWVPTQLSTYPENTGLLVSASADGWIRTWKWATGANVYRHFAGDYSVGNNAIRGFVFTK